MSYDIIYGGSFIKAESYYIPIVLIGSSNVYDSYDERARVYCPHLSRLFFYYPSSHPKPNSQLIL